MGREGILFSEKVTLKNLLFINNNCLYYFLLTYTYNPLKLKSYSEESWYPYILSYMLNIIKF